MLFEKLLRIFITCGIFLLLGCASYSDCRQEIVEDILKSAPDVQLDSLIADNSKREVISAFFTPEVSSYVKDSEISVFLCHNRSGSSGIYHPYIWGGISCEVGLESNLIVFSKVIIHEVSHKLWFEFLTSHERELFKQGFEELSIDAKEEIEREAYSNNSHFFYLIACWTERFVEVMERIWDNHLYLVGTSWRLLNLSEEIRDSLLRVVQTKWLVRRNFGYLAKGEVRISDNFSGDILYSCMLPIDQIRRLATRGGVLLWNGWCSSRWSHTLHFFTLSPHLVVYNFKTREIIKHNIDEVHFKFFLRLEYEGPTVSWVRFNGCSHGFKESIEVTLEDLDDIQRNGLIFE